MSGFEITKIDTAEIGSWDFAALKTSFAAALKEYSTHVYTDEASAKADKAELNNIKKMIEDKRKEYKKICLAPYERVEKQTKELVAMIDIEQERISGSMSAFEDERKSRKEAEIKKFYDILSAPLGGYAERMFRRLLDKSWLTASCQRKKWETELKLAVASSAEDIRKLKDLGTSYAGTLVDLYVGGYTYGQCMAKHEEYSGITSAAKTAEPLPVQEIRTSAAVSTVSEVRTFSGDAVTVRMKASEKQIGQVMDFMKLIGVEFEIL